MAKTLPLFNTNFFTKGGWAPDLQQRLAALALRPNWRPKRRPKEKTRRQWVQFEPDGPSVPFYWSGKPAVIASQARDVNIGMDAADEALFVGYYVERGLLAHHDRDKVMKEEWHWHGLLRCLTEPSPAATLNGFMLGLPSSRATVWLEGDKVDQPDGTTIPAYSHVLPYVGPTTLSDVLEIIGRIPSTQWINLMLGSRFAREECLKRQAALLAEFRDPILRAYDIWELVKRLVPRRTSSRRMSVVHA